MLTRGAGRESGLLPLILILVLATLMHREHVDQRAQVGSYLELGGGGGLRVNLSAAACAPSPRLNHILLCSK